MRLTLSLLLLVLWPKAVIFAAVPIPMTVKEYKMSIRKHIMKNGSTRTKSPPNLNDEAQDLFPEIQIEKNLLALPLFGSVKEQPWSDDYWPIYKGILAARYAQEEFQEALGWQEAKQIVTNTPVVQDMAIEFIDELSPAEKFDLLLSDDHLNLPLTKAMWNQGEQYINRYGEVEKWMGICHGWAPASFMSKRPQKVVTVRDAKNRKINFYPSDIKALTSLLWANAQYQNHFIGGRCNSKEPELGENERPIREDCFDNNPGTFHLAVTNGIGIHRKSFVMDVTFDYEVWNQPVSSYAAIYSNLLTNKRSEKPKDVMIELKDYTNDPYKDFRNKKTKYIIGVTLEMNYIVETNPTHYTVDRMDFDGINLAYYRYDLELDEEFNIIGGEWHDLQHPDFLWRPAKNAQALTYYDYYLMSDKLWDGEIPLQKVYRDLGKRSAAEGSPLAYIVRSLIELSQNQGERANE